MSAEPTVKHSFLISAGTIVRGILAITLLTCLCWSQDAPKPKHPKLYAFAGSLAFAFAADRYDVHETVRGLRAGVAIEGNTWLIGSHPSAAALYRRDALEIGFSATPALLTWFRRKHLAHYSLCSGPVGIGIGHIQGGNQWKRLLQEKQ